jgi:Tol biopolymer transport system component
MTLGRRSFCRAALTAGLTLPAVAATRFSIASAAPPAVPGRILFVRDTGIWVWQAGDVSPVYKAPGLQDARWSPTATQIVYVQAGNSYSDLVIYDVQAGTNTTITYNQATYEEGTPEYVQTSFWALDPDWSAAGIIGFVSDYESPDGTFQLWLTDQSYGTYLAPAAQFEDNISALSLSADASLAAYVLQERLPDGSSVNRAILRDLSDGIAYPLAGEYDAFDPAISPDQQTVALAVRTPEGAMTDIFIVDRATGGMVRVTKNLEATNPCWSPDGKWLAYVRMVDYQFEVWVSPIVGGDPQHPAKLFKAAGFDAPSGISWTFS